MRLGPDLLNLEAANSLKSEIDRLLTASEVIRSTLLANWLTLTKQISSFARESLAGAEEDLRITRTSVSIGSRMLQFCAIIKTYQL